MSIDYEFYRLMYKPKRINYLLIAESPPNILKENTRFELRFFYNPCVKKHDNLFIYTMIALYPEDEFPTIQELRILKPKYLERFQNDNLYLIDSLEKPLNKYQGMPEINEYEKKSKYKKAFHEWRVKIINQEALNLDSRIEELIENQLMTYDTPLILISYPVYEGLEDTVIFKKYNNILNLKLSEPKIQFPLRKNNQKNYVEKIGKLLNKNFV